MQVQYQRPNRRSRLLRGLTPLAAAGLLTTLIACGGNDTPPASTPKPGTATPNFTTTIFLGDSLTAGFQNGSLLDTQQPHGWAPLVATQAKFTITQPLIASPGVPAVLQLVSLGPPPVIESTSGTSTGRDDTSIQPTDLAVPGYKLHDLINAAPTTLPTTDEDIITNLVLGFPAGNTNTQLQEAVAVKPTTVFVWIGSEDALIADDTGTPSSMTDATSFQNDFTQLMTTLHSQTTATLLVGNIPDVTSVPYLTPAATILQEASSASGLPVAQLSMLLGIQPASSSYGGDLVNETGQQQVEAALKAIGQGQQPTPLTDAGFLSAAEVAQVQQRVTQYNQIITQLAAANNATVVDVNALFAKLQGGITINNYNATTAFLGGFFGLDGTHPTNTGYALVANQFIDTLNSTFKTTIPDVDVSSVAASDPYFGPNIKPVGTGSSISRTAAARTHWLLNATKPGVHADPALRLIH